MSLMGWLLVVINVPLASTALKTVSNADSFTQYILGLLSSKTKLALDLILFKCK